MIPIFPSHAITFGMMRTFSWRITSFMNLTLLGFFPRIGVWFVQKTTAAMNFSVIGNLFFLISKQLIFIVPAGFVALEKRLLPFLEDYFELRRRRLYEYPPHTSGPLPAMLGMLRLMVKFSFFLHMNS